MKWKSRHCRIDRLVAGCDFCGGVPRSDAPSRPGVVSLVPVDYVVNEVGNRVSHLGFGDGHFVKKIFALKGPVAQVADIYLFKGNGQAMFNQQPLHFERLDHGGWSGAVVGEGLVREGSNELIFHAGFQLAMDRD